MPARPEVIDALSAELKDRNHSLICNLADTTQVRGTAILLLGPEPIIGKQEVVLVSAALPARSLHIATDGLRPFTVIPGEAQ